MSTSEASPKTNIYHNPSTNHSNPKKIEKISDLTPKIFYFNISVSRMHGKMTPIPIDDSFTISGDRLRSFNKNFQRSTDETQRRTELSAETIIIKVYWHVMSREDFHNFLNHRVSFRRMKSLHLAILGKDEFQMYMPVKDDAVRAPSDRNLILSRLFESNPSFAQLEELKFDITYFDPNLKLMKILRKGFRQFTSLRKLQLDFFYDFMYGNRVSYFDVYHLVRSMMILEVLTLVMSRESIGRNFFGNFCELLAGMNNFHTLKLRDSSLSSMDLEVLALSFVKIFRGKNLCLEFYDSSKGKDRFENCIKILQVNSYIENIEIRCLQSYPYITEAFKLEWNKQMVQ